MITNPPFWNTNFKLVLTLFSLILCGCLKDECKDSSTIVKTHEFNAAYFPHIMIYEDFDTIGLLKNGVDTILFFGDKIRSLDEMVPAKNGCGKESFKAVKQLFKSLNGDSIVLYYSVMLNYSARMDLFEIIFRDTLFSQFPEYIVNCDSTSSTITVLGKSYCVRKMGMDGPGLPFIYYSKDFGQSH